MALLRPTAHSSSLNREATALLLQSALTVIDGIDGSSGPVLGVAIDDSPVRANLRNFVTVVINHCSAIRT